MLVMTGNDYSKVKQLFLILHNLSQKEPPQKTQNCYIHFYQKRRLFSRVRVVINFALISDIFPWGEKEKDAIYCPLKPKSSFLVLA